MSSKRLSFYSWQSVSVVLVESVNTSHPSSMEVWKTVGHQWQLPPKLWLKGDNVPPTFIWCFRVLLSFPVWCWCIEQSNIVDMWHAYMYPSLCLPLSLQRLDLSILPSNLFFIPVHLYNQLSMNTIHWTRGEVSECVGYNVPLET